MAQAAGFTRPILHGLCTYGIAARSLLASWGNNRPEKLRSLFARFSAPVLPGETIRMEMYGGLPSAATATTIAVQFRAIAVERGVVVLDAGYAEITV